MILRPSRKQGSHQQGKIMKKTINCTLCNHNTKNFQDGFFKLTLARQTLDDVRDVLNGIILQSEDFKSFKKQLADKIEYRARPICSDCFSTYFLNRQYSYNRLDLEGTGFKIDLDGTNILLLHSIDAGTIISNDWKDIKIVGTWPND
jgi:hypothetical protein